MDFKRVTRDKAESSILDSLSRGKSVVLSGDYKVGKTTLLNKLATLFGGKVHHASLIEDPFNYSNWPKSEIIFLDEADNNPIEAKSLKGFYKKSVVATHNFNKGKKYIEYLVGKEPDFYELTSS